MSNRRKVLFGAAALCLTPASALAQSAFSLRPITPENELETDFLAAFSSEARRPAFRTRFLTSQVSLALASGENAGPLRVVNNGVAQTGVIFTSPTRLQSVLGAGAPHVELTGREALTRLRGGHVAINYRLIPMLTLEAEDVESFLSIQS